MSGTSRSSVTSRKKHLSGAEWTSGQGNTPSQSTVVVARRESLIPQAMQLRSRKVITTDTVTRTRSRARTQTITKSGSGIVASQSNQENVTSGPMTSTPVKGRTIVHRDPPADHKALEPSGKPRFSSDSADRVFRLSNHSSPSSSPQHTPNRASLAHQSLDKENTPPCVSRIPSVKPSLEVSTKSPLLSVRLSIDKPVQSKSNASQRQRLSLLPRKSRKEKISGVLHKDSNSSTSSLGSPSGTFSQEAVGNKAPGHEAKIQGPADKKEERRNSTFTLSEPQLGEDTVRVQAGSSEPVWETGSQHISENNQGKESDQQRKGQEAGDVSTTLNKTADLSRDRRISYVSRIPRGNHLKQDVSKSITPSKIGSISSIEMLQKSQGLRGTPLKQGLSVKNLSCASNLSFGSDCDKNLSIRSLYLGSCNENSCKMKLAYATAPTHCQEAHSPPKQIVSTISSHHVSYAPSAVHQAHTSTKTQGGVTSGAGQGSAVVPLTHQQPFPSLKQMFMSCTFHAHHPITSVLLPPSQACRRRGQACRTGCSCIPISLHSTSSSLPTPVLLSGLPGPVSQAGCLVKGALQDEAAVAVDSGQATAHSTRESPRTVRPGSNCQTCCQASVAAPASSGVAKHQLAMATIKAMLSKLTDQDGQEERLDIEVIGLTQAERSVSVAEARSLNPVATSLGDNYCDDYYFRPIHIPTKRAVEKEGSAFHRIVIC